MRIGINLLFLLPGEVGGTETYAAGLLRGLARLGGKHEFVLFLNEESASWRTPEAPGFRRVVCPLRASSRGRRYFFEQARLPLLLKEHAVDLVHSPGYLGPLRPPCPAVVTVPDLNYVTLAGTLPFARRVALGFFSRQAARRARVVITLSEFSRRAICKSVNIPLERVTVTSPGPGRSGWAMISEVASPSVRERYGLQQPYLAAVAGGYPHKNIPRLIEAFMTMRHIGPYRLVLIGRMPPGVVIPESGRKDIVITGFIPDEHMAALLSGATAFIHPSMYEGFGFPVLEAQLAGVPVACSCAAALPETAGDGAIYFDPFSIEDMAEKMAMAAGKERLRRELREKGMANACRFSWEQAARATLAVYERAAGGRGKGPGA